MQKLLIGGLVASIAGLAWLASMEFSTRTSLRAAEAAVEAVKGEQAATRAAIEAEIARLREAHTASGEERQKALNDLRSEVGRARSQASGVVGRIDTTHEETLRNLERIAARLDASENTIRTSQAQLANEINGVRQESTTAQAGVAAVSNEVKAVKADSSATKQQVDQALAELRKTVGDLGQMSGQIATNAQQIALLRQQGERNYTEFTVFKSKDGTRLGAFTIMVKKTDVKAQSYSLDLMVNDLKFEKKDRHINEPLQFYMGPTLYELVVNRVSRDQLTGYLATPKAVTVRPVEAQ